MKDHFPLSCQVLGLTMAKTSMLLG